MISQTYHNRLPTPLDALLASSVGTTPKVGLPVCTPREPVGLWVVGAVGETVVAVGEALVTVGEALVVVGDSGEGVGWAVAPVGLAVLNVGDDVTWGLGRIVAPAGDGRPVGLLEGFVVVGLRDGCCVVGLLVGFMVGGVGACVTHAPLSQLQAAFAHTSSL